VSFLIGVLAPAAIAAALVWLIRRTLPSTGASPAKGDDRGVLAAAAAAAVFIGYVLLPEWAEVLPQRHWQWLPFIGVGAAAVSSLVPSSRWLWAARWLLLAAAAAIAAWKLVPTWETLAPARSISIALVALYLVLLTVAL
jgi:hypothetical protein